jgi:hypothetical protein
MADGSGHYRYSPGHISPMADRPPVYNLSLISDSQKEVSKNL